MAIFSFWSGFQTEKEDQTQKRQLNKGHNLFKKLKKRVTVKIEEDNAPEKSMTQEHENVEVEQLINIEKNEMSKAEVKEIEPVEATFHEELNQEVRKM